MTEHIDDFLNIPHVEKEIVEEREEQLPATNKKDGIMVNVQEDEHTHDMNKIRNMAMDMHEEIADIARNVEPGRSARMFEVSGQYLKTAADVVNSKAKMQMDAAKLKLEAMKLHIEDESINALNSGTEVMADRNDLIKQLLNDENGGIVDVDPDDEDTKE